MSLEDIIIQRIRKQGALSFHDFMDMALYYPGLGYYDSDEDCIGKNGDFVTSPIVSSLFGEMIAMQLEEMWVMLGKKDFTVAEYGAGTGLLCHDIIHQAQKNPEFYNHLHYCVIEKSNSMREKQKKILPRKINWVDQVADIPPFSGCVLSNEVIDNFPVHQVVMEDQLMEVYVNYNGQFSESLQPAAPELINYLDELGIGLPRGYRAEINLAAIQWIRDIATNIKEGFVMTFDYGYPSSGLYTNGRQNGTLVCYHRHRINYSPFINIGHQDITSHVNFSALLHWGSKYGLELSGFTNQAYFLLGLGLSAHARQNSDNQETARLLPMFLMEMGSRLKVLIQHKSVENVRLAGLKFKQPLI